MRSFFLLVFFFPFFSTAQPKLVVGIVVDQMRYDYLDRFKTGYGEDGFKKLMQGGYNSHQTLYNYVPTYTGPGHASIYTGTTPSNHGIIGNSWYVRESAGKTYCTDCETASPVGTTGKAGKMCASNLLVTTVTDELKFRYGKQTQVYGIALKDRGAVLPAGHLADGAFWFESSGNWISSSCYINQLPAWLIAFNEKKAWKKYLEKPWNLLLPQKDYQSVVTDDNAYEGKLTGENSTAFPHDLPKIVKQDGADLIRYTPFGNSITTDLAIELLNNTSIGKDSVPDFLAISYSSPDYIGHHWGPQSLEIEDNYYRLDRDIARLISALEKRVGKENLLVFLTSDHGVAYNTGYLKDSGVEVSTYKTYTLQQRIDSALSVVAGDGNWVQSISNDHIYIDPAINKKVGRAAWMEIVKSVTLNEHFVQAAYTSDELMGGCNDAMCNRVAAGYNARLSGDVVFVARPGWMNYGKHGSTHGSPHAYDTRVPLIMYGMHIKKQDDYDVHNITDIAPTVSQFLKIAWPNACTGIIIEDIFEE